MQPLLESLPNGAVVYDRFETEVEGKPAEVLLCFVPGNAMTPFAVWHRFKYNGGALFWGKFWPGVENETALHYFKDLRNQRKAKLSVVQQAEAAAQ